MRYYAIYDVTSLENAQRKLKKNYMLLKMPDSGEKLQEDWVVRIKELLAKDKEKIKDAKIEDRELYYLLFNMG